MPPEPLSGLDTWWLRVEEPGHPLVNVVLLRFARPVPMADMREWIDSRLLSFPRFRQRVSQDGWRPAWKDGGLIRDRHLREARIASSDEALRALIDGEIDRPLDRDLPLWDMTLAVDESGAVSALVT